jgi:(p)ppGpp synthase/HD superfamily hydrolase
MKLVDKVNKLFEAKEFSLVEVGVIAMRLGIEDKKEEIHERLFKQMFDEIRAEIDKAIPVASKSELQSTLEYIENRISLRPEQRKVK